MTNRLPVVGGDDGNWGTILNDFLGVSHNPDGTLISGAVASAGAEQTANKNQVNGYAGLDGSGKVPGSNLPTIVNTFNGRSGAVSLAGSDVTGTMNFRGPVIASTAYNPGDVIIYVSQRLLVTNAFTTGSGSPPFVSGANVIPFSATDEWHATDYGILGDFSTDNGANLTNLWNQISANSGGTCILPSGWIESTTTFVLPTVTSLRGAGWLSSALKVTNDCDVLQTYKSPDGDISNAFFCYIVNLELHGNLGAQTPGAWFNGLTVVTNPGNTLATHDADFDVQHYFEHLWIKLCTGEGYYQYGRSEVTLNDVWVESVQGTGFWSSYDTEYVACKAEGCGIGGWYIGHSDVELTACKAYNNGTTALWTSGQDWSAGQSAVYNGSVYNALNALTSDVTAPPSDPGNWMLIRACPEWGTALYIDGTARVEVSSFASDENAGSGIYLHNSTNCTIQGRVSTINTGNGGGTAQLTNPDYNSAIVIDGSNNNVIDFTSLGCGPAGYVIRLINGSTGNVINITTDGSEAAIFSPDSMNPVGSGNYICVNGKILSGLIPESVNSSIVSSAFSIPKGYGMHRYDLDSDTTFTMPTAVAGEEFTVFAAQDSTGSRVPTFTSVVYPNGNVAPTWTTTPSEGDLIKFLCLDGTNWLGTVLAQGVPVTNLSGYAMVQARIATGAGASSRTVTLNTPAVANNLLIAVASMGPSGATATTPTGFTLLGQTTTGDNNVGDLYIYSKIAAGGETSVVFDFTGASSWTAGAVFEVSGAPSTANLDGSVNFFHNASSISTYSQTYGSAPAASGEFTFVVCIPANAATVGSIAGWSQVAINGQFDGDNFGFAWFEAAGSGAPSINPASLSPAGAVVSGMVVFKA